MKPFQIPVYPRGTVVVLTVEVNPGRRAFALHLELGWKGALAMSYLIDSNSLFVPVCKTSHG